MTLCRESLSALRFSSCHPYKSTSLCSYFWHPFYPFTAIKSQQICLFWVHTAVANQPTCGLLDIMNTAQRHSNDPTIKLPQVTQWTQYKPHYTSQLVAKQVKNGSVIGEHEWTSQEGHLIKNKLFPEQGFHSFLKFIFQDIFCDDLAGMTDRDRAGCTLMNSFVFMNYN